MGTNTRPRVSILVHLRSQQLVEILSSLGVSNTTTTTPRTWQSESKVLVPTTATLWSPATVKKRTSSNFTLLERHLGWKLVSGLIPARLKPHLSLSTQPKPMPTPYLKVQQLLPPHPSPCTLLHLLPSDP